MDHDKDIAQNTVFYAFTAPLRPPNRSYCLFLAYVCFFSVLPLPNPCIAESEAPTPSKPAIETEIQEALEMQEGLLKQVTLDDKRNDELDDEGGNRSGTQELRSEGELLSEASADPRRTPPTPVERSIPEGLFEEDITVIDKGVWENTKKLRVLRLSLDVDNDGKPEQLRYLDPTTRLRLRTEEDRNYDGQLDAWSHYRVTDATLHYRWLDNDDNGEVDRWETYEAGRIDTLEIDRDGNGRIDLKLIYGPEFLDREEHDTNGDGQMDRHVIYENGQRREVHEDLNHDGEIDVISFYKEGKLKRRQIKQAPTEQR